jgi:choline dehydrogenase-like flavoprotein
VLNGRSIHHPRRKLLGGPSAINSHALVYPSKDNIDAWSSPTLGNPGWDWEHLEPYSKKFQTINPPTSTLQGEKGIELSKEDLLLSGPVLTSYPLRPDKLRTAWIETFQNLGCLASGGPLSSDGVGALTTTYAIENDTRERSHAGNAYLQAVRSRPNLHLRTNAVVERFLFEKNDDGDMVATGVQYTFEGKLCVAGTRGQVLVCAGAFQSPQILETSGIGTKDRLISHGIDCVYENPNVGGKFMVCCSQQHFDTAFCAQKIYKTMLCATYLPK